MDYELHCTPLSLSNNGNICGFFKGKKGLGQGDPISPLLFVMVMEYFTRILKMMSRKQNSLFTTVV